MATSLLVLSSPVGLPVGPFQHSMFSHATRVCGARSNHNAKFVQCTGH
jgi:hypothetical protein